MLGLISVKRQQGYTLLELLVTLAIVAILASIAVPSFNDFIRTQRLRSVANDLATSFQFARSESVKRNIDIVMSRNNSSWNDGWNITENGNVLRSSAAVNGVEITASATSFTFQSNGRASASGSFSLAIPGDSSVAKCVRVSLTGSSITDDGAC